MVVLSSEAMFQSYSLDSTLNKVILYGMCFKDSLLSLKHKYQGQN